MKFNNEYSSYNTSYTFETQNNSTNFDNIIFLTTSKTASSSELLINALKPYANVSIIGTKTRGKPVGMRLAHLGDKLIYWLINFSFYNANGVGDYYNGLTPTCEVDDTLSYSRGDTKDNLLYNALKYLETNTCIQ